MSHETSAVPSRRTVAKGLAWSVPAVTVAALAPTVAASTSTVTVTVQVVCNGRTGYFLFSTSTPLPTGVVLNIALTRSGNGAVVATNGTPPVEGSAYKYSITGTGTVITNARLDLELRANDPGGLYRVTATVSSTTVTVSGTVSATLTTVGTNNGDTVCA